MRAILRLLAAVAVIPSSMTGVPSGWPVSPEVIDLRPGESSSLSGAGSLTTVGSLAYFVGTDSGSGSELWKTDGTPEGTGLVLDISPGAQGSKPSELTAYGDMLVFLAPDGANSSVPWVSRGTAETTHSLVQLDPERDGTAYGIATAGGRLFFATQFPSPWLANRLWVSDGSEAGTHRLKDLPKYSIITEYVENLTALGSELYFTVGGHLWKSDGTTERTVSIGPDDLFGVAELTPVGDSLFFAAISSQSGREVWKTDGTAEGTFLVADIAPGEASSYPVYLTALRGVLIFVTQTVGSPPQLWRSDGTPSGTFEIADAAQLNSLLATQPLAVAGGFAYFAGGTSSNGSLWRTDGTASGTIPVSDILPTLPTPGVPSSMGSWAELHGRLLLSASTKDTGPELYVTDGTPEGTRLVRDIQPGPTGSYPSGMATFADRVLFFAYTPDTGTTLWSSDGTSGGTVPLRGFTVAPLGSNPFCLTTVGDNVLFWATGPDNQIHLLKINPRGKTEVLGDVSPIVAGGRCKLVNASGMLFFEGQSLAGSGLWRSDGTQAGTISLTKRVLVSALTPVFAGVAFVGGDSSGYEPWYSDGTPEGTHLLKDIAPGSASSMSPTGSPYVFAQVGSKIYFGAQRTPVNSDLWESNGTTEGTKLVKDLAAERHETYPPYGLISFRESLYFFSNAAGLWRSDGTETGTVILAPSVHVCAGSGYGSVLDGRFYFGVVSPDDRLNLWSSDGTDTGTRIAADIGPRVFYTCPNIAVSNGLLFIETNPALFVYQVWRSDGTSGGTFSLTSFTATDGSTQPFDAGGFVVFTGYDGFHGAELWRSDGTSEGTGLWLDLAPGPESSSPDFFALLGDRLFFAATSPSLGREPWSLSLSGLYLLPGRSSGPRIVRPR